MSDTNSAILKDLWNMDQVAREMCNVYTLDDDDCIKKIIKKILDV